ncbi:MAG: efflux RND transporter periplasmic adaptor subunit [Gemmatimonadales bacterium]
MTTSSARNRHRILGGAALGAGVTLAAWLVLRPTTPLSDAADDMAGMPGMEGMAGMPNGAAMSMTDGRVRLTADQVRTFGITVDSASVRPMVDTLRAVGTVTWDETRLRQVTARVDGYVEVLQADFTGTRIHRGAPLLELYAPVVVAAGEDLLAARDMERRTARSLPGIASAEDDVAGSIRRRLARWDVPESFVERVLADGQVPRRFPITAPMSGLVIEKGVQLGQAIRAGDRLFTIVDPSTVWVEVAFRELDASRVRVGQRGTISLTGETGPPLAGRVTFVHPVIDPATRTLRARLEVQNASGRLQAGRFAAVEIHDSQPPALTVPRTAIITTGTGALVFRMAADGTLEPLRVAVGRVAGDLATITSGLEPGVHVVTSAQYLLEAESNLGAVMKAMVGQMGGNAMPPMDGMGGTAGMDGMPGMPGMPDTTGTP